jgi:DNA-directed RNA polymerase alpha subunit
MANKKQFASEFDFVPGAPARRALANAGYTRLKQLTKITESELLNLHGMGPKAMGAIKDAMKARGLAFKPATNAQEPRIARS